MTIKNLLYCLGGLVLGFLVGFLVANQMKLAAPASSVAVPASDQASSINVKNAPPLDPSQDASQLPPGHPDINSIASDGSPATPDGVAATSADAQAAMEAADRKPADFDLQLKAADTFAGLKSNDQAALYFERALKLKPKDADALTKLGNIKYDAGDFPAAADLYTRALAVRPDNADVRTDLGNTYFQRNPPDYPRAIEEYRRALEVNPQHEKALQNMASAALNLRDKATARDAVDKLASVNPSNETLASLRASLDALP
jgi:tetratricopeptide (TPR) repeat protein